MKNKRYPDCNGLYSLAVEVGAILKKHASLSKIHTAEWKEKDNTPATQADKAANLRVIEWMKNSYPHITVIGEENERAIGNEWKTDDRISDESEVTVIVDPLDGTLAFMQGFPVWSFVISVLVEGIPQVALVYDPIGERCWNAERGKGAYLNRVRLHVSDAQLSRSLVSLMWWKGSVGNLAAVSGMINAAGGNWINTCAVGICGGVIAEGRMAASVFGGESAWETPAMQLLVEEAGGVATDLWGDPLDYTLTPQMLFTGESLRIPGHIISNGVIHEGLLQMVQEANPVQS